MRSGDGEAPARSKRRDVNVAVAPDIIHEEAMVALVAGIEREREHSLEPGAAHFSPEVEERLRQEPGSIRNAYSPSLLHDVETVAAAAWSRGNEYWVSQASNDVLQRPNGGGARVRRPALADDEHDGDCGDHRHEESRNDHRSAAPALHTPGVEKPHCPSVGSGRLRTAAANGSSDTRARGGDRVGEGRHAGRGASGRPAVRKRLLLIMAAAVTGRV